jgi:hypothetical protein
VRQSFSIYGVVYDSDTYNSTELTCDVSIAIAMIYYLQISRTGMAR